MTLGSKLTIKNIKVIWMSDLFFFKESYIKYKKLEKGQKSTEITKWIVIRAKFIIIFLNSLFYFIFLHLLSNFA